MEMLKIYLRVKTAAVNIVRRLIAWALPAAKWTLFGPAALAERREFADAIEKTKSLYFEGRCSEAISVDRDSAGPWS